jgi:hypothetical protein
MKKSSVLLFTVLGVAVVGAAGYRYWDDQKAEQAKVTLFAEAKEGSWSAAESLGKLGKRAVPSMVTLLQDEDWKVKMAATQGVFMMNPDPEVSKQLAVLVSDFEQNTGIAKGARMRAAEALGSQGREAIPHIEALWKDGSDQAREMAAYVITNFAYHRPLEIFALEDIIKAGVEDEKYEVSDHTKAAVDWVNNHFTEKPGDERSLSESEKKFLAWIKEKATWSKTKKTKEQLEAERKMAEEGANDTGLSIEK